MKLLMLISVILLALGASPQAAEKETSTARTIALMSQRPYTPSNVIKVGSCSVSCPKGSQQNDCDSGQSCSCFCHTDGSPTCSSCR